MLRNNVHVFASQLLDVDLNFKAISDFVGLVLSKKQLDDCSPQITCNHKITGLSIVSIPLLLKVQPKGWQP